jgi:hypothetical protein
MNGRHHAAPSVCPVSHGRVSPRLTVPYTSGSGGLDNRPPNSMLLCYG